MEAQRCDWTSFSAGGIDELCDSWIPSALSAENEWRWDYLWNLWRAFLFNSMNTQETHKVSQNMVSAETMPAWLKGTETGWNVRNLLDFQNSMGKKTGLLYYSCANMCYPSRKRKSDSKGTASRHRLLSPGLETLPHWSLKWHGLGDWLAFHFLFWNGNVITVSLCLSHCLYFGSRQCAF